MGKHLFFLIFAQLFFNVFTQAQLLPPYQPEQDACNALLICGNTFTSPYGYQGIGTVNDLTGTPCGGGEGNTLWLRIEVNTPGIIVFTIAPLTITDDYDMAVIDITNKSCSTFNQSDVIRCNFNNNLPTFNNGITGLNTTSNLLYVAGGTTGSSYLQQINAAAGDVYLIMINNFGTGFSGPVSGFTIDFTGSTATFNQSPPPAFAGFNPSCDYSHQVTLNLTEYVRCTSIAPDGSDFSLWPSGTIQSVQGVACTNSPNGYTDKIQITFNGTLPNGNYKLMAETGTDGNTLLGLCGGELQKPDSVNFTVGSDPIKIASLDSPACKNLTLHLEAPVNCNSIAANGSDFIITGPSNVPISGAQGLNCTGGLTQDILITLANSIAVDGTYQLKVKVGTDGNTLTAPCNRVVEVNEKVSFNVNSYNGQLIAKPDTIICNTTTTVNLYGFNNGVAPAGGFQYQWTPTAGVANPNSLTTSAQITQGAVSVYHLETMDANGCYLRDSNVINMAYLTGSLSPQELIACYGDAIPVFAGGGTKYQWFDNPGFSGVPNDLSCHLCPNPFIKGNIGNNKYYVVVMNDEGCADTLSVKIDVQPVPFPDVQPKDTTIKYGESVMLSASGAYQFSWYPMGTLDAPYSATPWATPKETTVYTVAGADEYGCLGFDSAIVRLNYRSDLFIPNSFTPNGDGLNDVFGISNLTFQKILAFRIFDRYGNMVFETSDPKKGWDGTIKDKPAPQGVYYYYIHLGYADDYTEEFKGDITLLR